MGIYTYNPSEVNLSICGYKVTGWTEIAVEFDSKAFKTVHGIRGTNARVQDKNTSATIRLSVLQTGLANYVLSEIHRQDINGGAARLEIDLKDNSGDTRFHSDTAYIENYPDFSFTAEAGTRSWVINCLSTRDINVGTNFKPLADLF